MLERIITALVLVAVVLSCMFATQSHYPMFVLMIIAAGVAGYEWFKLMPRTTKNVNKPLAWGFGLLSAGLATLALYFNDIALLLWAASILCCQHPIPIKTGTSATMETSSRVQK